MDFLPAVNPEKAKSCIIIKIIIKETDYYF